MVLPDFEKSSSILLDSFARFTCTFKTLTFKSPTETSIICTVQGHLLKSTNSILVSRNRTSLSSTILESTLKLVSNSNKTKSTKWTYSFAKADNFLQQTRPSIIMSSIGTRKVHEDEDIYSYKRNRSRQEVHLLLEKRRGRKEELLSGYYKARFPSPTEFLPES